MVKGAVSTQYTFSKTSDYSLEISKAAILLFPVLPDRLIETIPF